ncbi:MAG: lipid IV(A) 3-deoxy-D-manno-octulosonic acid transferase [Pseudomonadales bacterium]|nr:lipid IV(A) 3-deoxy-D-manno-octulosonic acid transferase [Pseudomonadales bacterium]
MIRHLYSLLFYLCLPIIFIRLLLRSRHAPEYRRRWAERLGFISGSPSPGGIWIHSVSVGETLAAVPLVKRIQTDYPDLPVTITTMTPTGSEQVRKNFTDSVFHVYIPYDLPTAVGRMLNKIKPRLLVVMETELWPNLIDQCHRRDIPVVIANARLSERSAVGYGKLASLVQPMLKQLSLLVAQAEADCQRFERIGMDAGQTVVSGNIKFDISLSEQIKSDAHLLRAAWGLDVSGRKVWIAASTHDGEEPILLAAFQRLLIDHPSLLLLIVPRHPERFNEVEKCCNQQKLNVLRFSSQQPCTTETQVVIGDTMGELMRFYGVADIAFVGGSLVETGGHNLLEAAAWQLPIISGPYLFNFTEADNLLSDAGALIKVSSEQELAEKVDELLGDTAQSNKMGRAALGVIEQNRGSLDRLYQQIIPFL